ncbi:hypothetical protein [Psychroserpens mesophilus]|uniref:hypothetical protein n=1 Tax=Psychroserpens mesophilus TaxID=325473 RepID=UPI003D6569F6
MTIYQLLNEKNNLTTIVKLIRNKVILNSDIIHHISIYDDFYKLTGTKGERYKTLGDQYNLHPDTIRKIISKLNKSAK